MSDGSRATILRPKVRFSQSAESPESSDPARAFPRPRIRSVVDLKGPSVKILKAPPTDFAKSCESGEKILKHSAGDAPNDLSLCPSKSTGGSIPCLTEIVLTPENHTSRSKNDCGAREMTKNAATQVSVAKSSHKEINEADKLSAFDERRTESSKGTKQSCSSLTEDTAKSREIRSRAKSTSQLRVTSTCVGKENICLSGESKENVLAAPENTPRSKSDNEDKGSSTRRNASQTSSKPREASRKKTETSEIKKVTRLRTDPLRKSVKEIGLMPCMKMVKDRSKSAPVKKTILRDVSSSRTNVYVGPGVSRPKSLEPEIPIKSKAPRSRSEILSGDKLARPEYNSIVGTIKKLQDLRKEKVIKDLDHLPAVYRGLVNGRVSSALDFGANEAIYRDLVDLSIDEKQLPSRLTRSKDPEPRQRDLVPKLSDFFVPTNDEEYRKAVLPRPPSPRVLDTCNPYKISDRIFAWKESLDHDV